MVKTAWIVGLLTHIGFFDASIGEEDFDSSLSVLDSLHPSTRSNFRLVGQAFIKMSDALLPIE
jgi:hypothetical protein